MTIDVFKVPQAELIILQILWDKETLMTTEQLIAAYREKCGKTVKASTINTLAGRLMKKGLITYVQANGRNLYIPVWRKEKFQALAAMQFLDVLFNGSVAEMVLAMLTEGCINVEDWKALQQISDIVDIPAEETSTVGQKPFVQNTDLEVPIPLAERFILCKKSHRTKCVPRAA